MKYPILAVLAVSLLAVVSDAQETPQADAALEYAHYQILKGFTIPMDGASGSLAFHANRWFGVVGDAGVYLSHGGTNLTAETYALGPRFSYCKFGRLVPFAEVLVGGTHFSGPVGGVSGGDGHHFTFGFGGGGDIVLGPRFALRGEVEYFGWQATGATINNIRLSGGVVYRFGKR